MIVALSAVVIALAIGTASGGLTQTILSFVAAGGAVLAGVGSLRNGAAIAKVHELANNTNAALTHRADEMTDNALAANRAAPPIEPPEQGPPK